MLYTIDYRDIRGATNNIDVNLEHITTIRQERHFSDRALICYKVTLITGENIEVMNAETIAKIKLIMKGAEHFTVSYDEKKELVAAANPRKKK